MALSQGVKDALLRGLMRYWSDKLESLPSGLVKSAISAAIDNTDAWVDSNAASYNAALPEPFRSSATADQKSIVLVTVALAQYDPELLKRLVKAV